jgi:hypothetical protein
MSEERQTCDRLVVAGMIVVLGPFVLAMSFVGVALAVKAWGMMVEVVVGGA